jgi:hypothetical protein
VAHSVDWIEEHPLERLALKVEKRESGDEAAVGSEQLVQLYLQLQPRSASPSSSPP